MIRIICIICATLLSQNILAQNIDQNRSTGERLPTAQYTPGGVAIIALDADKLPTVTFNDIPVAVLKTSQGYQAMVGIPLSAEPGWHQLEVSYQDGSLQTHEFEITKKDYPESYLSLIHI